MKLRLIGSKKKQSGEQDTAASCRIAIDDKIDREGIHMKYIEHRGNEKRGVVEGGGVRKDESNDRVKR